MSLLDKLRLNETYFYNGTKTTLTSRLLKQDQYKTEIFSDINYKLISKTSFGILLVNDVVVTPIYLDLEIKEEPDTKLKIGISTAVRIEHYFLLTIFILVLVAVLFIDSSVWNIVGIIGLWCVCHIWFHFVYRTQENALKDSVVKTLMLKKEK